MIIFTLLAVNALAQTAFDYLTESLVRVLAVSGQMQIAEFEYNGENALWGAYLEPGAGISLNSQFDAGIEYLMFASAHTEKAEIYLKVYRGQGTGGTVVKKDTTPDAAPIVRFIPSVSGWHCFELINASNIPAFVSLVILKAKKNAGFNLNAIAEARKNALHDSQSPASLLPPAVKVPANKWILFGGNIRRESAAVYDNVQLAEGNYALVGAGENSVTNCDAEVIEQYAKDNPNGRKISKNSDSRQPFDYAFFTPVPSKYHYFRVINQNSRNSGAFMLGFLILAQ
ncbi:MAG: hypothetical protein LBB72_00180 [Spirochaetaceae bacterium]|nr:hypothetical protein [Spirochaetaceae bacterium]